MNLRRLLALICAMVLFCSLSPAALAATKTITGDDFIVDTLDGVPAYPTRQCNELALRYYEEVFGVDMFVGVNSPYLMSNYFRVMSMEPDQDIGDIPDEISGFHHAETPKKGDIVYWSAARRGKSYAHTALVKSYSNGVITLIEQNWNSNGKAAYERQVKYPSDEYVVYTLFLDSIPEEHQPSEQQPAATEQPTNPGVPLSTSTHHVKLNGFPVSPDAYLINEANYFKIRDIAMLLNGTGCQFSVDYIPATKDIILTTGEPYVPLGNELTHDTPASQGIHSPSILWVDGVQFTPEAYMINNANYYKLADLKEAFGFDLQFDPYTKTVMITTP